MEYKSWLKAAEGDGAQPFTDWPGADRLAGRHISKWDGRRGARGFDVQRRASLMARAWRFFPAVAILWLAACSDRVDETRGQKLDSAIEKTQDATVAAARKAAEVAEKARDNTKAYINSPEVKQHAADAKEALKDAGSALKSTTDDAAITVSVTAALARDPELSARRIDVHTQAGAVRLAGPAPSAQAKARAETIAKAVKGVASVDNRLEVGAAN